MEPTTRRAAMHVSIACVMVLLQPACSSGKPGKPGTPATPVSSDQPLQQVTQGELKLILGPHPDDTILVHTDGSFELVSPQQTSIRACGGVCPRSVEQYAVHGDTIMQGSRELLTRAADGTVNTGGLFQVTIDDDGAIIMSGQRRALDASGRLPHLDSGPDGDPDDEPDVTIVGATTPELRRRAMLVAVFFAVWHMASVIDRASH